MRTVYRMGTPGILFDACNKGNMAFIARNNRCHCRTVERFYRVKASFIFEAMVNSFVPPITFIP